MENKLQIFENSDFGKIRIVIINEELWFVGSDVTVALGYKNPQEAVRDHVHEQDRQIMQLSDYQTPSETLRVSVSSSYKNRRLNTSMINESGLYTLILHSKLSAAEKFQRWITSEVLPSIRKTGSYNLSDANRKILELAQKVAPLYHCAVVNEGCIALRDFSLILSSYGIKIGRNTLFKYLRDEKILGKDNLPYLKYVQEEFFKVIYKSTSKMDVPVTYITPLGQLFFFNRINNRFRADKLLELDYGDVEVMRKSVLKLKEKEVEYLSN
jgi:prophage antirepressor-like protein